MRFTDLLENYIILKDNDKELYYDIKDNINDYMNMIKEYLSYKLIITIIYYLMIVMIWK